MKPLNILWLCSDQQRWDTLGCSGNPWVRTPHLDALAARGVRFANAFCQSTVCMPSRSSFLTGRYPRVTGCAQNGRDINLHEKLVPRVLRDEAGYACGFSGKLHITRQDGAGGEPPFDTGYDTRRWSPHSWPAFDACQYRQWLKAKGVEFKNRPFDGSPYVLEGMPEEYSQTRWCADAAIEFIEQQKQPWLFSVNWFQPHYPFEPVRKYLERYLDRLDDIPLPKPLLAARRNSNHIHDCKRGGPSQGPELD